MSEETSHLYKEASDISKRLDYFILSFNVAFLSWTATQSSWIQDKYSCLLIISWSFIIVSIIAGTIRQIFLPQIFEANIRKINREVESSNTFDLLAKVLSGYIVQDEDGNIIPEENIKKKIDRLDESALKAQERFNSLNIRITICFWVMYLCMIIGILCFLSIRILSFG